MKQIVMTLAMLMIVSVNDTVPPVIPQSEVATQPAHDAASGLATGKRQHTPVAAALPSAE